MLQLIILFSFIIFKYGLIGSLVQTAHVMWWFYLVVLVLSIIGVFINSIDFNKLNIIYNVHNGFLSVFYILSNYIIVNFAPNTSASLLSVDTEFALSVLLNYLVLIIHISTYAYTTYNYSYINTLNKEV